jgi:hypothetical protein
MDLQPFNHNCFSKISRTLFDYQNNTHRVSLLLRNNSLIFWTGFSCFSIILYYSTFLAILEKQLANILDRGFLFLRNTLLLYSLSPYSQTDRQTESQIHLLCMGWRNFFTLASRGLEDFFLHLCCCVSFWFWRGIGSGFTYLCT